MTAFKQFIPLQKFLCMCKLETDHSLIFYTVMNFGKFGLKMKTIKYIIKILSKN